MRRLFTNILNGSRNKVLLVFLSGLLSVGPVYGFKTEWGDLQKGELTSQDPLSLLEAGRASSKNVSPSLLALAEGRYKHALSVLTPEDKRSYPWLEGYLEGLVSVSKDLIPVKSDHFQFFFPPDQTFLRDYAIPALEQAARVFQKNFGFRPSEKIRVEIYPTKEAFSMASTLTEETLKRSGAIGICKFHRLMILTPRALPMGYRWMDALAHEYMHLIINELSWSRAELWLHEGTARYFDTFYRVTPPNYLSPHQKTKLMEALEEDRLIEFKRMSPSLVYLDSQEEVSLAFAQVSHAVQTLVADKGTRTFVKFLRAMRKKSFPQAFFKIYGMTPVEFENSWKGKLAQEEWEKTKGALSDDVRFQGLIEDEVIGAHVQGRVWLGDRMRQKGRFLAALVEYEKALKEEPDNAVILLKGARTHLQLGETRKALSKLRKAVKSNPNYGTPHIELAKLVEPQEALPLLKTANALNPFNPEIHILLAQVWEAVGEKEKAERERMIGQLLTDAH